MIDSGKKLFGFPIHICETGESVGGDKNLPAVTVAMREAILELKKHATLPADQIPISLLLMAIIELDDRLRVVEKWQDDEDARALEASEHV